MSAELGSTNDPKALVPGSPHGVHATSVAMTAYGDALHEAGEGLKRIDSAEGWDGPAAENFRSAFDGEPSKWLEAGDCFHHAATALDQYSNTLTWAQGQATEAIRLWNEAEVATSAARADHAQASEHAQQQAPPGAAAAEVPFQDPGQAKREAAQATLDRARNQLATAGETAADTVGRARDKAPEDQSWLGDAMDATGNAAGTLINGAASLGNAALNHPTMAAGMVGGAALTSLSAAGETAGVILDATGVGAVGGVPLNAISAAGVATGVGMMGASMAGLASEASGDDETEVVDTSDADPAPAPELPWEDPEVQESNWLSRRNVGMTANEEVSDDLPLEQVEQHAWGDAPTDATRLMATVHRLRRKPIKHLTAADLRTLIAQRVGLAVLVPRVLPHLERDPYLEADYYPGDLLVAVLRAPTAHWQKHPQQRARVEQITAGITDPDDQLKADIDTFHAT